MDSVWLVVDVLTLLVTFGFLYLMYWVWPVPVIVTAWRDYKYVRQNGLSEPGGSHDG